MANKPKSMLQIRRILQLIESDLSSRKIASQLSISRNTVDYYKKQFRLSEKSFSELSALQDHELSHSLLIVAEDDALRGKKRCYVKKSEQ